MEQDKKRRRPKGKKSSSNNAKKDSNGLEKPKRFLTAYNFFFMNERAAFLKSQTENASSSSAASNEDTLPSSIDSSKPWTKKTKRQHVKTHGKIDFKSLSNRVAAKWKSLSDEEKKPFSDMAAEDLARYRKELKIYKEKVVAEEHKAKERGESSPPQEIAVPEKKPRKHKKSMLPDETKSSPACKKTKQSHSGKCQKGNAAQDSTASSANENNYGAHSLQPLKSTPYYVGSISAMSNGQVPQQEKETVENNEKMFPNRSINGTDDAQEVVQSLETTTKGEDCTATADNNRSSMIHNQDDFCQIKAQRKHKLGPFIFQPDKLYGRDTQTQTILEVYRKISQSKSPSEMVVISGYSGAGKSALVEQIQQPITNKGGNFICGKFDHFRQMEPLSAIIMAFAEFCTVMATKDAASLHQIRVAIEETVESETAFLATVIPSLQRITPIPSTESVKLGGMEAQHRLKYVFQLFVRAIATPSQPLVLFLDDLQWADPLSLELIESLVTDTDNKSFLLIGSYRDNEVDENHPLATQLRSIESKQVKVTKIEVGDLTKEDTNELISNMIQTPPYMTQSLTNAVYRKTSGNVLFILQFLSSICDEGHLFFSADANQWQWDTAMIESKNIADGTVELMLRKILKLPTQTQSALKLMACLGYCCEEFVVSSMACGGDIGNFGCTDLIASLESAIKEGLVDHVGSNYKFAHDQIQLAAYSLIPEKERGNWHFWIGCQVWANKSASPEKALFIVVGQLNRGSSLMKDTQQRIQLAGLNLQAAQKSKSLAAYVPSAFYLNTAISLLDNTSWADHYDLCLELYSSCAEAEYCIGSFDEMHKKLNEVFANAKCLDDKLDAFFTLIASLMAQDKGNKASDVGLLVLSQLGESFPTYSDIKSITVVEFAKAKQMIGGKSDDELLTMKAMDDGHKVAAMRLMYLLAHTAFLANREVFALIILRMVQTSLTHGVCGESAYAFAAFGSLMGGVFGDINGGYRFGELSLRLLDRIKAKKCLPGVYAVVYICVHPWVHHYHASLGPLQHAYNVGMRCGDVSYAVAIASQICFHTFHCGEELSKVETTIRNFGKMMLEHKQEMFYKFLLPYWQAVLNLMGQSDDPEQLVGEVMDQEHLLREALECKLIRAAAIIFVIRSWLAYIFGNYDLASKMMEKRQAIPLLASPPFFQCSCTFTEGLISFAMAQKTGEAKWKILGDKSIEAMKKFALYAPSNCQHKLLFLQAESAFLLGEFDTARERYNDAINNAGENGFIQDQALAYERAGVLHSKQGNGSMALKYQNFAHNAHLKWGAKRKAEHLRLQYQL